MNETAAQDEWTGCVHCGQALPHVGTSWRETPRCRLFQRIAEQAWDQGWEERDNYCSEPYSPPKVNPFSGVTNA